MKRALTYIAIAAILAVGCTKSELPQPDIPSSGYTPSDSPICFDSEDNWGDESDSPTTKGEITTSTNLFSFSTFGYYFPSVNGEEAQWNDATIPNFMYNQKVERTQYSDGESPAWSYSPKKYWSENPNDRFMFFACAPHSRKGVELSYNYDTGAPIFTVIPNNRPVYHQDFMTAKSQFVSKKDGIVKFDFEHKLAQAKIYAAHNGAVLDGGSEADTVKILGITVKGMRKEGRLIYDKTTTEYVWEHMQNGDDDDFKTATYNFWAIQDGLNELDGNKAIARTTDIGEYTDPSLKGGQAYMFLVPQENLPEIEFILFFDYYSCKNKRRVQSFQRFILDAGSSLEGGKTTAYLLLVKPETVGYGTITTTVKDWTENTIFDKDNNNNDWVVE